MRDIAATIGSSYLRASTVEVLPVLGKGAVNHIFVVRNGADEIVVRINARLSTLVALDVFTKEAWCLEQAATAGIHGPQALRVGELNGTAYMILSCVAGRDAEDAGEDRMAVWRTVGNYAQRIHRIELPSRTDLPGEYPTSLLGPLSCTSEATWQEQIHQEIGALAGDQDPLRDTVYPSEQREYISAQLEALKSVPFRAGLNHGDLLLRNVMVDSNGRAYLLDWGSAVAHIVPHYDISQIIRDRVECGLPDAAQIAAFFEGYGIPLTEYDRLYRQSAILLLMRRFNKARWAVQSRHPDAHTFAAHARAVLVHVLSLHPIG